MLKLDDLENKIDYVFKSKDLLIQSLTHTSVQFNNKPNKLKESSKHYERLEFLGDRVLGLVVSEYLFSAFPNEDEGDLNLRFAQLVRKEACTQVAIDIELNEHVILGNNEQKSGLSNNPTILGDVCEALIAALFLDGGMNVAKLFILRHWKTQIKSNLPNKQDAKTALQEWAQKLKLSLPIYSVIKTTGPAHAPEFTIEVTIIGKEKTIAIGQSKRIAEQKAATEFLIKQQVWPR